MYDVKQVVKNATSIYAVEEITIARPGSVAWQQAFELADSLNCQVPDTIEFVPACYEDPEAAKPIGEDHILEVKRDGEIRENCIAVICSGMPSAAFPEIPEAGGIGYQFIYKGDQVYITNQHGATIEVVK